MGGMEAKATAILADYFGTTVFLQCNILFDNVLYRESGYSRTSNGISHPTIQKRRHCSDSSIYDSHLISQSHNFRLSRRKKKKSLLNRNQTKTKFPHMSLNPFFFEFLFLV